MEATALTAHSNDDPGPSPRCAVIRVSSSTVARLWNGCSSRRTMSSPTRAVDRHRPRGGVAAPGPVTSEPHAGQLRDDGGDDEGVGGGERAGQLDETEGVGEADRQRAHDVAAAHIGADGVADLADTRRLDP